MRRLREEYAAASDEEEEEDEYASDEEEDRTLVPAAGETNVFRDVLVPDTMRTIGTHLSIYDIQALRVTSRDTFSVADENAMIQRILLEQFLEPYARANARDTRPEHPYMRLFSIFATYHHGGRQLPRSPATWTVANWRHLCGAIDEASAQDHWARHMYKILCDVTGRALAQAMIEAPRLFEHQLDDTGNGVDNCVPLVVLRDAHDTPLWRLAKTMSAFLFDPGSTSEMARLPAPLLTCQRIDQRYELSSSEEQDYGRACRELMLDEPGRAANDPARPSIERVSAALGGLFYREYLHEHPMPLKLTVSLRDGTRRELSVATGFLWEAR